MINIITNYKTLLHALPQLIEVSGYKSEYIAKKLDMRPGNFSVKKQRGNWTVDEVETIINTISNKDVEVLLDKLIIKYCFEGDSMDAAVFEKKMGWK
ncbi:MAG: hypothetical protein J7539_18360 [Niabella sp.]|nr:hypothetical protein [Niabella sp.]